MKSSIHTSYYLIRLRVLYMCMFIMNTTFDFYLMIIIFYEFMNSSINQIINLCTISNLCNFSFSFDVFELFIAFVLNLKYKVWSVSQYTRHCKAPKYVLIWKLYILPVNLHSLVLWSNCLSHSYCSFTVHFHQYLFVCLLKYQYFLSAKHLKSKGYWLF